jgi:signal transduction histidine kinase
MANEAMQQAKSLLAELLEAARTGRLIPIRLPDQITAIQQALLDAEKAADEALALASQRPNVDGDAAAVMEEYANFIKTAIHELRTPMTSIRGYSDMLANPAMVGEMSEMQANLLTVIRTNSRRMEGLLSDISILNKVRAGILRIDRKMDMFKNIAQMAEKQTRPVAEELGRQLEFDIPQGLPILETDGEHFATALVKLIENGLRYSAKDTGKVIVTGRKDDDGTLIVQVTDNGIGMSEDELARLGEVYYRGDRDEVREYKGSGLGTAIAFGLIKALGGEISVESAIDKGTTCTIRLKGMS